MLPLRHKRHTVLCLWPFFPPFTSISFLHTFAKKKVQCQWCHPSSIQIENFKSVLFDYISYSSFSFPNISSPPILSLLGPLPSTEYRLLSSKAIFCKLCVVSHLWIGKLNIKSGLKKIENSLSDMENSLIKT